MTTRRIYDAAIVGGGPAGAATALRLARRGLRAALCVRPAYDRPSLGEMLPPQGRAALEDLELWPPFAAAGHLAAPGIVRGWETAEPREQHYLCNPYGCGWRLDRSRFDDMLVSAAASAGAAVLPFAVASIGAQGEVWELAGDGHGTVRARFLVDASGRGAAIARRLGAARRRRDGLIALAGQLDAPCDDPRLLLEACPAGWWHSGPLPCGKVAAVLMTDADLLPRGRAAQYRHWRGALRAAPLTLATIGEEIAPRRLRCVSAAGGLTQPPIGPRWLAVGDAAASFDPLSSRGIPQALETARRAAAAIEASLDGDDTALDGYADWLGEDFTAYLALRSYYYALVTRFPDSPFWRRRGAAASFRGALPAWAGEACG